jgi:ATPase subunit of ABC transporter with duplicated ATPase domains
MSRPTSSIKLQVAWLSEYLISYPKAFLVVSHDQEFLRKIANVVFVLENQTLTRYKGNYDYFLTQHALDKEQYEKNYEAQQRYIKKEETFIAKHIVRATSSKAAKSHRARLSHLEVLDEPGKEEGRVFSPSPSPTTSAKNRFKSKSFRSVTTIRFSIRSPSHSSRRKNRDLRPKRRGQNHLPQDCFLTIPALGGSLQMARRNVINYYNQDEKIDLSLTPFAYVHNVYPNLDQHRSPQRFGRRWRPQRPGDSADERALRRRSHQSPLLRHDP